MRIDTDFLPCLVLDTNVVLDLLHFSDAAALSILHALEARRASCCVTTETLDELRRVLTYPEFKLDTTAQTGLLARYRALSRLTDTPVPNLNLPRCSDPDDQKFLGLAAAVAADFLISKDRALLKLRRRPGLGSGIVTPGEASLLLRSL
jgi:uncharacterized protein